MDALAAASAKQPAVPTTMSKSMAMPFLPSSGPAPMAPWHKTSPLPAPPSAPWRSATLPAPPQKASAPSTPWPLQSSSLHSDGLPSFVDRVAGVLGPSACSDVLPLDEYKSRLATIYSVHNPSNVSKIGYLLSKYKDQEQLLYQSVCSKYQIPSTWDGRQPLPSLPSAIPVQPSDTQHKDQAAQGDPVNGSAKLDAAIPPPWAREKATTVPRVDLSKSESKEADDDFFESEAALKALQILTQDMGEPTRLPKQLKPAPEVPSAKGMAKIDYFLLGEKTGFFSDEETVEDVFGVLSDVESEDEVKDQAAIDLQEDEEKEKMPPSAEPGEAEAKSPTEEKPKKDEEEKPEVQDEKADIREAEDVDQEEEREKSPILAQPVMPPESSELQKEELRKAEERQRRIRAPKRKLPEPKAASKSSEATVASMQPNPAANPQRPGPQGNADDDDDDEVVVLSVSAGDKVLNQENGKRKVPEQEAEEKQTKVSLEEIAAEEKDTGTDLEDAQLGEQMRADLGASLARHFSTSDPQMPAKPAEEPNDESKRRLAAAAAVARGFAARAAESDSESDSESYSQSSDDEEDMNAAPGAADNGTAPKGERSVRDTLLGEIFQDLQVFSGTPGRATMKAMQRFVSMVGFEGSDNEWREEYLSLCKEWKMDPDTGFNQEAFTKMCNDESDIGCYCNDVELQLILNKLVAAPKKKETKKRKQPDADSPEKRQKVEIAFQ